MTTSPSTLGSDSDSLSVRSRRVVPQCIQTSDVFVEFAAGSTITDVDRKTYIDFAGGVGCTNLGHRDPEVVARVKEQVDHYLHQGFSLVQYEPYVAVCELLARCHPGLQASEVNVFLMSSGVEAIEAAVKVARIATGRRAVICLNQAFHGRTALGSALTDKNWPFATQQDSEALGIYRTSAPYDYRGVSSADALAEFSHLLANRISPDEVAAVIYEPVQGEGGFLPLPTEFIDSVARTCNAHGILLVADEIQSGACRTGLPSASHWNDQVVPDVVVWGKSLGGGLPLSAVSGRRDIFERLPAGAIASGTLGGNPVSCAAATAVLERVLDPEFQRQALEFGDLVRSMAKGLAVASPLVGDVRGLGAMQAFELVEDATLKTPAKAATTALIGYCRAEGLLIKSCGVHGNVVRILAPVTTSESVLRDAFAIMEAGLQKVGPEHLPSA